MVTKNSSALPARGRESRTPPGKVKIYKQYPQLDPFVGDRYREKEGSAPRLLIIGESSYLPEKYQSLTTAEKWYEGKQSDINKDGLDCLEYRQQGYINGAENKTNGIWKKLFSIINEYGPKYNDFKEVIRDVAYFNFFLRPGIKGGSIAKNGFDPQKDTQIANEQFRYQYEELKPTAILFISKFAYNHFRSQEVEGLISNIGVIRHPCSPWWNRTTKNVPRNSREELADFIKDLQWPKA